MNVVWVLFLGCGYVVGLGDGYVVYCCVRLYCGQDGDVVYIGVVDFVDFGGCVSFEVDGMEVVIYYQLCCIVVLIV